MTIRQYNEYGKSPEDALQLRTYPIAVRFFESPEDVPADAACPRRDLGKHIAEPA